MPNRPSPYSYRVKVEIGLIVALVLLIAAFRAPAERAAAADFAAVDQPTISLDDIPITDITERVPPTPKPPQPVEVPDTDEIEEVASRFAAEVDVIADIGAPPTPPVDPPSVVQEPEPEIFVIVEERPEMLPSMPQAMRNLQSSITYPEIAKRAGVEGRVIVQFVVDEQGNVLDPFVVRGIGAGCDEEAVKAVRTLKFRPGKQRGRAVKVQMTLPVTFRLR